MSRIRGGGPVAMLILAAGLVVMTAYGCREQNTVHMAAAPGAAGHDAARWREEQFNWPVENLNRMDEFDSGEVLQKILVRLKAPQGQGADGGAIESKENPLLTTWPEPEVLRQVIERLNQWIEAGKFSGEWKPNPLLESLPKQFAELPMVKDLDALKFTRYDEFALLETVWLRDVSTWARGDEIDELLRAQNLFDWTIRNLAWNPPTREGVPPAVPLLPWESLFFGTGTPLERAWVFILLARQQGLDAVMLAIEDADEPNTKPPRPWAVAVLIEGKAYLFDAELGLPLPSPGGIVADERGALSIRPATLEEVVADEGLLGSLDADGKHPYRIEAKDLKRVVALVEASPVYCSKRMSIFESKLTGQRKMVLSTDAAAQAERWKAVPHVCGARLWQLPYETLFARMTLDAAGVREHLTTLLPFYGAGTSAPLRRGRMLYLKGRFQGEPGAIDMLQAARPANEDLSVIHKKLTEDYFQQTMQSLPPSQRDARSEQVRAYAAQAATMHVMLLLKVKESASYWLGLISYQTGGMSAAVDYFARRTLQAFPDGVWTLAARYNLARTFEASGEVEKAAGIYRSNTDAPDYAGALLRAKWLDALSVHPK